MERGYRRKETRVFLMNDHVVFCPKRRRNILVGPIRERLIQTIRETAPGLECEVLALEVMPDHVHLLLSATPRWAPNQLIGRIKGKSPRLLRQEFLASQRMPSVWTRSFFISTAGNAPPETVARYIVAQATRG
jgi:putative transposase